MFIQITDLPRPLKAIEDFLITTQNPQLQSVCSNIKNIADPTYHSEGISLSILFDSVSSDSGIFKQRLHILQEILQGRLTLKTSNPQITTAIHSLFPKLIKRNVRIVTDITTPSEEQSIVKFLGDQSQWLVEWTPRKLSHSVTVSLQQVAFWASSLTHLMNMYNQPQSIPGDLLSIKENNYIQSLVEIFVSITQDIE